MKYFIRIRKHPLFFSLLVGGLFFLSSPLHAQVKYKFTTTGLGLGTDTPASLLHLKGPGGNLVFETSFNPNVFLSTSPTYSNRFLQVMNSSSSSNGNAGGVKTGGLLVSGDYSFANPTPGQLIVQGNIGVGTNNPAFGLDILDRSIRVHAPAVNDATPNLAGISLSSRGVGGTEHRWTMYTAAVGGGFGVTANAYEIWQYPPGESIPRFKILKDGTTLLAPSGGVVGIGMYSPNYRLAVAGNGYFSGNVVMEGILNVAGNLYYSDRRIKNNILPLSLSSVGGLKKLQGVSYFLNSGFVKDNKQLSGLQYGLVAQEVKEIFPNLVAENEQGLLSVNYTGLIPLLIEGYKNQQLEIETQKTEIETLKAEVEKLKAEKARMAGLEERMAALEKMMLLNAEEAKLKK